MTTGSTIFTIVHSTDDTINNKHTQSNLDLFISQINKSQNIECIFKKEIFILDLLNTRWYKSKHYMRSKYKQFDIVQATLITIKTDN